MATLHQFINHIHQNDYQEMIIWGLYRWWLGNESGTALPLRV
jgi:hypothetical protein